MTTSKPRRDVLTPKQEAVAIAYAELGDATKAYRSVYNVREGTKDTTVWRTAHALITLPKVAARVTELRARTSERAEVSQAQVLRELARIAFVDIRDIVAWDDYGHLTMTASEDLTPHQAAAIKEIKFTRRHDRDGEETETRVEVKLYDKQPALAMLGRYTGGFDQRVTIDGKIDHGVTVQVQQLIASASPDDLRALLMPAAQTPQDGAQRLLGGGVAPDSHDVDNEALSERASGLADGEGE